MGRCASRFFGGFAADLFVYTASASAALIAYEPFSDATRNRELGHSSSRRAAMDDFCRV